MNLQICLEKFVILPMSKLEVTARRHKLDRAKINSSSGISLPNSCRTSLELKTML
jgi:hypothetical protein